MSVLSEILDHKKHEVSARATRQPLADLQAASAEAVNPRGFIESLVRKKADQSVGVIAEIKKASPSKGLIRADFNPTQLATSYAAGGATCLSVLTDEQYFQGSDEHLKQARAAVDLPILRKDFVVDEYQIWESKVLGADCILLIVAALSDQQLQDYYQLSKQLQLDVLVEVHDAEELDRAIALRCRLIGINNRNLHTFETRLETTEELAGRAQAQALLVCESGIHSKADITRMRGCGVQSFLIGETFMRDENPGQKLAQFISE